MNILLYEEATLRREPIMADLINCNEFENVFSCRNEQELEQTVRVNHIDVLFTGILNYFDSNLPSILRESEKKIKVLAYVPNELDVEEREFYKLSDYCYLSKYNPSIEDVIKDIKNVFQIELKSVNLTP